MNYDPKASLTEKAKKEGKFTIVAVNGGQEFQNKIGSATQNEMTQSDADAINDAYCGKAQKNYIKQTTIWAEPTICCRITNLSIVEMYDWESKAIRNIELIPHQ